MASAPDFTLPAADGSRWSLADHLSDGPVLLVFYRGDWWPYCNGQLASYARMGDRFEQAGVQLAAIVNDSVEQNAAMVDKLLLPFPVLSDGDSAVIKAWDLYNEREDVAKPSLQLVRADGTIAYSYVGVDFTDRPTDEEMLAGLASLEEAR